MALFGNHILVGIRNKNGDPDKGGIAIFKIYRSKKVQNSKPFLLGTDVKTIIVGEFNHGGFESDLKKKAIVVATGNSGLYEATLKNDIAKDDVAFSTTPINVDRDGRSVDIRSVDNLFQRDSSQLWFSSDNKLYFVDVR